MTVQRYAELLDISVRSEGDGRTVDAYAAAFGIRQEIRDREGHYLEEIAPTAFDRTLAQRAGKFQVIFNHGMTMHGTSSERYSMPYGTPLEMRADEKGLWTTTKIARTALGDEILELVKDGAIRGQSFGGHFVAGSTELVKSAKRGELDLRIRGEIALREYGLTPFPAYAAAHVVGVRSEAAEILEALTPEELRTFLTDLPEAARADMLAALRDLAPADTGTDETPPADTSTERSHKAQREAFLRSLNLKGLQ